MKKKFLSVVALAMLAFTPATVNAQDEYAPSATNKIYDFSFMGNEEIMLNLFYNALKQGRNYPTKEEFEGSGMHWGDLEFVRSHVRPRAILDRSDRVVAKTYEKRNLWMNLPAGSGKLNETGFPSSNFHSDVYSMWNYTNLFGSWNHPLFGVPGAWVDAAHRNGSDIFSGIKFFDTTGNVGGVGAGGYMSMILEEDENGEFKYIDPLLNILMFFGSDGINYNFEASGYNDPKLVKFHKLLYKRAAERGFKNFHIGIYTSNTTLGPFNVNSTFGGSEGRTAEVMLNYGGESSAAYSLATARKAMNTTEGVYQGFWIVSMDRAWSTMAASNAKEMGICLWGEHADSRFWSYNKGKDALDAQMNYQKLLERGLSGGRRNPIDRPRLSNYDNEWEGEVERGGRLSTFCGMAEFIPERSAIQGNLPFATHFNLGNGDRYNYKGKKTGGSWYNMSCQDVVPTYRWLIVEPGTMNPERNLEATFSHYDSYIGGSCLELESENGATADLILYKTKLNVSAANPYAVVALKTAVKGKTDSHLKVLLRVDNNWVTADVPNLTGDSWQEFKIPLAGVAQGAQIDRIGLRVENAPMGYKMYVGQLEINDDVKANPASVKDLNVEVKEETTRGFSLKLNWGLETSKVGERDAYGLLYNDEANVDHFEILYKDGENGRVREIGRTSQWATYIGGIQFAQEEEEPFVGVRAVSTDLKTYSPIKWVKVKRANPAKLPEPDEGGESYGVSEIDPSSDGVDKARRYRFLEEVRTTGAVENLNYERERPVGGNQYIHVTNQVLKVKQGQEIKLFFKAYTAQDGLKFCVMKGWLDLDGSGTFGPNSIEDDPKEGECLFSAGTTRKGTDAFQEPGYTVTFTIPNDAHVGKSRLRMVFTDAWFTGTLVPTGLTSKGFSIDFDVEIQGDPTNQREPKDSHDKGVADEPAGLNVSEGIQAVQGADAVSDVRVVDGIMKFDNVEKAWIYTTDGKLVKVLANPTQENVSAYSAGVYVVKMQNKQVTRNKKVTVR